MGVSNVNFLRVVVFLVVASSKVCTAGDVITQTSYLRDPGNLTSAGGLYTMGFFSPNGSTNRYVGIWCNVIPTYNVLWVANREDPVVDSSGVMMISADGRLVVMDRRNETLWSSSVSGSTARIFDTGNLVLFETNDSSGGGNAVWESFMHPTDSMLPNSKLSSNIRTNEKVALSSWKSPSDPSIGSFSLGVEPLEIPEVLVWKGKDRFWRSGPWNGKMFIGVPYVESTYHDGFILAGEEGNFSLTFTNTYNTYSYHVLKPQGEVVQTYWNEKRQDWDIIWTSHLSDCDVYGKCGPFGMCDVRTMPICSCLEGFQPKFSDDWSRGNWTSGCERKSLLKCNKTVTGSEMGNADEFLKLENAKVPNFVGWLSSAPAEECLNQCLVNCSCAAYAYDPGIGGCMYWSGDLIDLQTFSAGGIDLYIRLARGELGKFA